MKQGKLMRDKWKTNWAELVREVKINDRRTDFIR
jgi:hypothetical protein